MLLLNWLPGGHLLALILLVASLASCAVGLVVVDLTSLGSSVRLGIIGLVRGILWVVLTAALVAVPVVVLFTFRRATVGILMRRLAFAAAVVIVVARLASLIAALATTVSASCA